MNKRKRKSAFILGGPPYKNDHGETMQRWKDLTAFLAKGIAPGEVEPFANGSVVLVAIPFLHNCGVSAC